MNYQNPRDAVIARAKCLFGDDWEHLILSGVHSWATITRASDDNEYFLAWYCLLPNCQYDALLKMRWEACWRSMAHECGIELYDEQRERILRKQWGTWAEELI